MRRKPGRLGRHERRVAAVPAVRHDDDDARRPQRAACPVLVERAERLADPRPAGPVVDRIGDAREGPVAVAVAQQAGHPGQARPEHERLRPDLRGGRQRLHEPEQQARVALHRSRDVAQDDERARLLDRAPPDPRHELAARPEVAPEHRPRRQPAAVAVEFVAARPASLQARDEQVHEALGLAKLGGRHPVEFTVAQDLALRVRVGRDDDAFDRRLLVVGLVALGRDRDAPLLRAGRLGLVAGLGLGGAGLVRGELVRVVLPVAEAAAPGSPPRPASRAAATIGRTPCRRSPGRRAAGRRSPHRPRGPARGRRCRRASGPARSRPRRRDRWTGAPPAGPVRTRPPRRAGGGRPPRRRRAS